MRPIPNIEDPQIKDDAQTPLADGDQPPGPARTVLSVVVGARSADGSPHACLDALSAQVGPGIQVIVVEDGDSASPGPAWATRVAHPGARLVPELWAEGLHHATGDLVGLLASTVVPGPEWVARTLALHGHGEAGVGGAIEPGTGLSLVDWGVYFCRYAPYLLPIDEESDLEVPGDNASYRTDILARYRHLWDRAFWEPSVHHAMRADGHRLRMSGDRVVLHAPGAGARAFCRQRFAHGRAHGELRSTGGGRREMLRAVVTAPLVPPLLTVRAARAVFARRRLRARFLAASPVVLWFYCWWAAGELSGRLRAARSRPRR